MDTFDASVGGAAPSPTPPPDAPQGGPAEPIKRRRGRPFGSRNSTLTETPVVTEGSEGSAPDATPVRKRRAKAIDASALAKQIQGMHILLAKMVPLQFNGKLLLELDEKESTQLAESISAVCREYNIEIGGKVGAGFQLLITAAMVYGPRAFVINQMRLAALKAQKEQTPTPPQSPLEVAAARANGSAAASAN